MLLLYCAFLILVRANKYDIDSIRAIPFVMVLAQMREFSSAFYGTGTAFETGAALLMSPITTARKIVKIFEASGASLDALKDSSDVLSRLASIFDVDVNNLVCCAIFEG